MVSQEGLTKWSDSACHIGSQVSFLGGLHLLKQLVVGTTQNGQKLQFRAFASYLLTSPACF